MHPGDAGGGDGLGLSDGLTLADGLTDGDGEGETL